MNTDFTYEYLPWRGVTAEVMRVYNVKTKIDHNGRPVALGFPYGNGSFKIRSLEKKEFWSEGSIGQAGLFGRDKFSAGGHKYVTITEGELDALSLHQAVGGPVVSVQSAATGVRDCIVDLEWLNSFDRVYLAFDNDEPGKQLTREVFRLFDPNKVYHVRFSNRKDANDFVREGDTTVLRNLWWNSRRYLPEAVISSLDEFRGILTTPIKLGVSYPFPTLTSMTYGIRPGESVLITAQEGVGKTELMHSIEHHLLKRTEDNVGAIFLEEPKQRHLQAIAGIELGCPAHLPDCGRSSGEIVSALESIVRRDDRLHIYSHFGSDDPDVLLDTIRFLVSARCCLYVLLDHISMVVSGLAGEDERRALDYIATRLEMMVKELMFSLIMVSHVNDDGKTRGSRYISKIADVRIDATRDLLNGDEITRNTTCLTVSKNRFGMQTGPAGKLLIDTNTYRFSEITGFAANDNKETVNVGYNIRDGSIAA